MGVDGDEADRLFAVHRAKPLAHLGDRKAEAPASKGLDADEIAVAGLAAIGLGDAELLVAHLLVHRHDAAAARVRVFAEHAEDAPGGARQQLDHAAGIGRPPGLVQRRDAHQCAIADARRGRPSDARFAGRENRDARQRPERLFPFGRHGDQVAVAVARGDVGEHDLGQGAFLVQAGARALDLAFQLQFFQDFLE